MAEGSIQKEGTEPGLLASMKTLSKEKGKLNPGDVLFLALEHRKGNLNEALLLAHNTLRSLARGGDYGLTAVQRDDSFFSTHLETIRDGDNAGPWYHLYGTAFFEVESRSGLSGVRIITLMSDMGSSGIESLKSILGYETSGKSTTDIMSILANIGEQLYREKASGRVPDPEKWCFNVWGAQIASRLLAEAGEKPHSSTLSVPYRPPIASPVAKELPDGTLQDSHGHTIVMCPLKVHWKGQQGEMFFNLTNGSIQGDFPVQLIPFFESDETMGLIWQDLGDEPYDVSYEAVEDGTFRMAYVERQSQTMSVFETSEIGRASCRERV